MTIKGLARPFNLISFKKENLMNKYTIVIVSLQMALKLLKNIIAILRGAITDLGGDPDG